MNKNGDFTIIKILNNNIVLSNNYSGYNTNCFINYLVNNNVSVNQQVPN